MREIPEDIDNIASAIVRANFAEDDDAEWGTYLLIAKAILAERNSSAAERERLRGKLWKIADFTANCVHDGGFDREIGPIGCMLGDKCLCIVIHPVARDALSPEESKP